MIKNCKYCNKEFQTNHKLKKYCDMICYNKEYREMVYAQKREITKLKQLNNMISKNCKYCNKEVTTSDTRKIYCNIKCQQTINAEIMYAKSKEKTRLKKIM